MNVLDFILLLLAAVCFLAAVFNAPVKVNLIAAGLLLWVLTLLIKAAGALH